MARLSQDDPESREPEDVEPVEKKGVAAGPWWSIPSVFVACCGGLAAGYLNTHFVPPYSHVTMEAIVAIALAAALAGALCPRLFWVVSLVSGLMLPAFHLFVQVFGVAVPRPVGLHAGDFLVLVPAVVCAAGGAGWRLFFSTPIAARPVRRDGRDDQ